MFKRLRRYIKHLFDDESDKLEDPEVLIAQAQRQMQEMHVKNRERAVQAIVQKNNLQSMVNDTQKRVDALAAKAEAAEARGDREMALQLRREKLTYEMTLLAVEASLVQAVETVEAVKIAMRREEERLRQKTAEALALKTEWKLLNLNNPLDPPRRDPPNPLILTVTILLFALTVAGLIYARHAAGRGGRRDGRL